jgi:hypothetical protein
MNPRLITLSEPLQSGWAYGDQTSQVDFVAMKTFDAEGVQLLLIKRNVGLEGTVIWSWAMIRTHVMIDQPTSDKFETMYQRFLANMIAGDA